MQATLIVLAAGMGSRYGGNKQFDPLGPGGQTLMEYGLYDAGIAGFTQVVFVIRPELEAAFRQRFAEKTLLGLQFDYVFQTPETGLPDSAAATAERQKPWGTVQAVLAARDSCKGAFAVINADDFYGREAFQQAIAFFDAEHYHRNTHAMMAYRLQDTLSTHGTVNRGVCDIQDGLLTGITEVKGIEQKAPDTIVAASGDFEYLSPEAPVSMNFWCFKPSAFQTLGKAFRQFAEAHQNDPTAELPIPPALAPAIQANDIKVRAIELDNAQWFGMTHAADRQPVIEKLVALTETGQYPKLF